MDSIILFYINDDDDDVYDYDIDNNDDDICIKYIIFKSVVRNEM